MGLKNEEGGFTLMELMVVVGIIAILSAIAVGNLLANLPMYRLQGVAGDLAANFQRAKLEAMKRNTNVLISYSAGTGAAGGYTVCTDTNRSLSCDNPSDTLFAVRLPDDITLFLEGQPAVVGYTPKALPVNNLTGYVKLSNTQSLYYKATFSLAGFVGITTSRDNILYVHK